TALGDGATRFRVGDRVMAVVGGGAQAELIAVHERLCMPVPDTLEWAAAGGFPEVFTTAHDALFTQCGLNAGERLLVHGAAGAVNMAANLDALATGGRVAVIGVAAGATAELNLLTLMARRASIHASTLRPRPLEEKAIAARRVERHVLPSLSSGRVRVPVAV